MLNEEGQRPSVWIRGTVWKDKWQSLEGRIPWIATTKSKKFQIVEIETSITEVSIIGCSVQGWTTLYSQSVSKQSNSRVQKSFSAHLEVRDVAVAIWSGGCTSAHSASILLVPAEYVMPRFISWVLHGMCRFHLDYGQGHDPYWRAWAWRLFSNGGNIVPVKDGVISHEYMTKHELTHKTQTPFDMCNSDNGQIFC